jgi:intracellular multiplication protein IcmT
MASSTDDTLEEKAHWHWRNSMRPARFFNLDARAAIPYMILLFFFRPVTVFLCFVTTAVFLAMEKRGLSFPAALRSFRLYLSGDNRPGLYLYAHRKLKDYG